MIKSRRAISFKRPFRGCPGKAVGQSLKDHIFAIDGGDAVVDLPTVLVQIKCPTRVAMMLNVNDRRIQIAKPPQDTLGRHHGVIDTDQRQRARHIFILAVDQDQYG